MGVELKHITKRGGVYYYKRAVPTAKKRFFTFDRVMKSLRTKDEAEAKIRAAILDKEYNERFQNAGKAHGDSIVTFTEAEKIASAFGAPVYSAKSLFEGGASSTELVAIIAGVLQAFAGMIPSPAQVAVKAGAIQKARLTMNDAMALYKESRKDREALMTSRECSAAWSKVKTAVKLFNECFGDTADLLDFSRVEAQKFKNWLLEKIAVGQFDQRTANTRIHTLSKLVRTVFDIHHPDKTNFLDKLIIEVPNHVKKGKQNPMTEKNVIDIRNYMDRAITLHENTKDLVKLMELTGSGLKELALLTGKDIHLNEKIPFIEIQENELRKQVKRGGKRIRSIPLFDESLEIMKRNPQGFPHYQYEDGGFRLSRDTRTWIRKVAPGTTSKSYRHRMMDLLRNSGVSDNLKNEIVGHESGGMEMYYGKGFTLEVKMKAMQKALKYAENERRKMKK